MSHCIRCGEELPFRGAECPECRVAFDDVAEDSAFIADDDDEDEDDEPVRPRSRAARWEKVLDQTPVFSGVDDDDDDEPSVREPYGARMARRDAEERAAPEPPPEPAPVASQPGLAPALPESEPESRFERTMPAWWAAEPAAETPEPAAAEHDDERATAAIHDLEDGGHAHELDDADDAPPIETSPVETYHVETHAVEAYEAEEHDVATHDAEHTQVDAADAELEAATVPTDVVVFLPAGSPVAEPADEESADDAGTGDEVSEDEPAEAESQDTPAAAPDQQPVEPSLSEWIAAEHVAAEHVEEAPWADEPVDEQPVEDEPAEEQPLEEEPVTDELVAVELARDEPAYDEPAYDEPAYDEPAYDEPVAEQPTYEEPVVARVSAPVVLPVPAPIPEPVAAAPAEPAVDVHTGPADVRITTRFELHSAPAEGSPVVHALVDLEPSGAPLVSGTDGPLAHVIVALDLSASMNDPRKYPVLTRAIEKTLADLKRSPHGDILVSLVVFAYGAETLVRAEPASQLDPRGVLGLIDRSPLRFSRYTDLVGALSRAGRIALDSHVAMPRVPIRMYVLTDGKPQDMAGARRKMAQIRRIPVDVHGLAFGDDADFATLQELICGARGGTVKHVRSETLESAFERIAEVSKRVVAKRSLLDLELKGGVVGGASYRFRPGRHAYGKRAFESGQVFHTDLGTLESGRRYSLLFQLRLPPTQENETEIGRITLRIPGEGGPVTFERLLFIARHPGAEVPAADEIVVEARHVVEAVDAVDLESQLKALRARRRLYVEERRDPYIIELIDRAIEQMETRGSLDALSNGERAALRSHTQSIVGAGA